MGLHPDLSRRAFLSGSAGLTFAVSFGGTLTGRVGAAFAQDAAAQPKPFSGWVTIALDNTISIAAPGAEMGQGAETVLPMILAEELDADWAKVKTFTPPPDAKVFGNPGFGGLMISVGSRTTPGYWDKLRLQGAAIRRVLMQAAADKWSVPLAELKTEPSAVVHAASGQRLTYGEIAAFATVPAEMPKIEKTELKKTADYRIIGHDTMRLDIPAKTNGSAQYAIDAQVPGMVYATLLRAPVESAKPDAVDATDAKAIEGVTDVITLPNAVAIVADTVEAAFAGRDALQVTWSTPPQKDYSSETALGEFQTRAGKLDDKGVVYATSGDLDKTFAGAAKVVSAQYTSDYVYHAQMEPMNVLLSVSPAGDAAEVWVGTQGQTAAVGAVAEALKIKPEAVTFHEHYLGGGFGRRSAVDIYPEAVAIAKAVKKPVKLIWTREQDIKSAKMRPMTAHNVRGAFDAAGNLIGWHHRVVAESVNGYTSEAALERNKGIDGIVLAGAKIDYAVPNVLTEYVREKRGMPLSAWRGIGAGYNKFVIECFIDELAAAQKVDPVEFRLNLMKKEPRALAIIKAVAEMSGWGTRKVADGRAIGFGFGLVVESWTAAVSEISLDRQTGEIRVHDVWTAVDSGIMINPNAVVAQMEGCAVFGISQMLKERVSVTDGAIDQTNYYDYPVLRMAEVPAIHVKLMPTDNPPTGIGEAGLPMMGASIGNAFFALTGRRLRQMPFTPERVKAAITGA